MTVTSAAIPIVRTEIVQIGVVLEDLRKFVERPACARSLAVNGSTVQNAEMNSATSDAR